MKIKVFALALFLAVIVAPNKASGQACKAADATSARVAAEVRRIATTNNAIRDSLHLPLVTAAQVVLVSDTATCSRVRQALDSMIVTTTSDPINLGPRAIYTIQVGTFYAVVNPGSEMGEHMPVFFFNNLFSFLRILGL